MLTIAGDRWRWVGVLTLAAAILPVAPGPISFAASNGNELSAPGESLSQTSAEETVAAWVDAERIPGAVLLVSRDGLTTVARAFGAAQLYDFGEGQYSTSGEPRPAGLRRLPSPTPMTVDTVFDLASLTKVMATTFAVMMLVDDGLIDLDATVDTYLPDFRQPITIQQLLTHRSGLSQWQPIYYDATDSEQAYAFIRDFPLAWEPGAERHYSDLGFMLLGLIIEQVTEEPIEAFLSRRLYAPLSLTATGYRPTNGQINPSPANEPNHFAATSHGNPFERRMVHDPEFGYAIAGDPDRWSSWRDYTLIGEVNDGNAFHAFGGVAGHAGLFSTAADLQALLQLLLNRGQYEGRRFIKAETVDTFLTSTGDRQALGWQVPDNLPAGSFSHTGFTGTYVAAVPSQNLAIVLLTNRQNVGVDENTQYPDVSELQESVAVAVSASGLTGGGSRRR